MQIACQTIAGSPCRVTTSLVLLILRRISNHSPNPSPIFGKGLNRSSCRSFIKVRSGHQSPGVFFLNGGKPPNPHSKTFRTRRSLEGCKFFESILSFGLRNAI